MEIGVKDVGLGRHPSRGRAAAGGDFAKPAPTLSDSLKVRGSTSPARLASSAKRSYEHHDKATRAKIPELRCPADVSHLRVEGRTQARVLQADQRLDPADAWRDRDAARRPHVRGELAVGPWAA